MNKEEITGIINKRIEYINTDIKLTKEGIIRAQSNKDYKSAIGNMTDILKKEYGLYVLKLLKEDFASVLKADMEDKNNG